VAAGSVLQIRRDANLSEKSLDTEDRAEFRLQHFERDTSIVLDVACTIDRRHSADTDLVFNAVAASERRSQLLGVRHAEIMLADDRTRQTPGAGC
jgi:hypothetical protein